MGRRSEAAKLRRRKVANRRGAFDTWGDASWDALLVRGDGDPADAAAACAAVGAVERDVTAEVLAGTWVPPPGAWALLVTPAVTPWSHLVSTGWAEDLIGTHLSDFRGETLRTGAVDSTGVLSVRHRRHLGRGVPEEVVDFHTDGVRWEPPEPEDEDEDESDDGVSITVRFGEPPHDPAAEAAWDAIAAAVEGTHLTGSAFPPDMAEEWLAARTSTEDAHHTLLRDADAYVPGLHWAADGRTGNSGRLDAAYGHGDFLTPEHVARVDVVRFGTIRTVSPAEGASRRLEAAVGRGDRQAVLLALRKGATVGVLPDSPHTALWLALDAAGQYGAKNRPDLPAIVEALLEAGADPNAAAPRDWRPKSAAEQLLSVEFVQTRGPDAKTPANRVDTLALLRRLIAAGLDVNAMSHGRTMYGVRPLHGAASQNRPPFVAALLDAGADPTLTDDRGLTPAAALRSQLAANAQRTWAPNHVSLEDGLAAHAEVLALLAAAGG